MRWIGRRVLEEAKRIIGIFAYLAVVFGILVLHESVVLSRHGIDYSFYGFAFLNAWILAKVMLLTEGLTVWHRLQKGPLIYPILYGSCVSAMLLLCAYVLEKIALGLWRGKTLAASLPVIGGGGVRGLAIVGLIMAVALIPYFAFREIGRILGPGRLHALLFKGEAAGARP
jgi:hypothetical protein